MARLRYNGLNAALSGSHSNSVTTITLAAALTHSNGTNVPTITGSDYIPLAILDSSGHLSEIVYLTAYTAAATTGTITRGQEGTTGVSHASGDKVTCSVLAADVAGVRDKRWCPITGERIIDEFNDSSLDGSWVRVDGTGAASGNVDWTEAGDVVSCYNKGGDSTDKFHALLYPLSGVGGAPSTGDAFITCVSLWTQPSTNFAFTGLVLTDGTTFGSGNQVWAEVGVGGTGPNSLQAFSWTNFGTAGTNAGALPATMPVTIPIFVRLVMTAANTWRADYSPDGASWYLGTATLSKTITPTHVGFFDSSYGTSTKHIASFEFVRRVSGVS